MQEQEEVIGEVQMKNGMDRMEGDKALNSSSRKDSTTQNEGKAKWERKLHPRKRTRLRSESNL